MLQQMGYESDPVKAWKRSQEKVEYQHQRQGSSYLPVQIALHICIPFLRMMRTQLRIKRRMKQRRRRPVGQTTTTCWACPCGSWPRRRKTNCANRGMQRCVSLSPSKTLTTNSKAKFWPFNRPAAGWTKHPEEEESSWPLEGRTCRFLRRAWGISLSTSVWSLVQDSCVFRTQSLVLFTFLLFFRALRQKRRRTLLCLLKRVPEKAKRQKWSRRLCPLHRAAESSHVSPAPWKLRLTGRQI